jgi:putative methyltransferase (TIGR04325 family)
MVDLFRKIKKYFFKNNIVGHSNCWSGNYGTWPEALNECSGYDSEVILTSCLKSLIKVRNGEYKYERDSVLFDEIQYSFGLLTGLLSSTIENNNELNVLDFGGSLGSTYFQNKDLRCFKSIKWSIVEQEKFVKCGKDYFENEELKFYYSIEECLSKRSPNVIILSGVLQYIENYVEIINQINEIRFDYIIIDRTTFIKGSTHRIVKQEVPDWIYKASYPVHLFKYDEFISLFTNYEVVTDFNSFCDPLKHDLEDNAEINWKGMILQIKK